MRPALGLSPKSCMGNVPYMPAIISDGLLSNLMILEAPDILRQ